MAVVDTVLLKVASRCNLNCTYCYVYNMGDDGWRSQPKRMSEAVQAAVVKQLGDLLRLQGRAFSVVLHGGEPLLLGAPRLERLLSALRAALPAECGLHLQTNGILLDETILDVCANHGVGISISLDGPEDVNDRSRVDLRGRGSQARVMAALERVRVHPKAKELFSGLLSVVDPRTDPQDIYAFFKSTKAPSVDFLYRDGNHDLLPFGKTTANSTEYGQWMSSLLDCYLADPEPPRIRVLDDMLKLILGGLARKEGVGLSDYGIVIIDTDGSINKNDTLKSTQSAADVFSSHWSVLEHSLHDVVNTSEFEAYHIAQHPSSAVCQSCSDLAVCGGGMPAHRWRKENGFDNPSVFCADQQFLIDRMRQWISRQQAAA
jgi:uncharacterized protein